MSKWIDLNLTYLNLRPAAKNTQAMHCIMNGPNSLYLGNINAANDERYLAEHGVNAVLSVIDTSDVQVDPKVNRMWIMAEDSEQFDLGRYFDQGTQFISQQLKHTNVLVHCYAGISRSSSLVIAYMIKYHDMSLKDALRKVRSIRTIVDPNPGFMRQLKQYEEKHHSQSEQKPRCGSSLYERHGSVHGQRNSYIEKNAPVSQFITNTNNKSFFQKKPLQDIANDPIQKFQKQKHLENVWFSCLNIKKEQKNTNYDLIKQQLLGPSLKTTRPLFGKTSSLANIKY